MDFKKYYILIFLLSKLSSYAQTFDVGKANLETAQPLFLHSALYYKDISDKTPVDVIAEREFSSFSTYFDKTPRFLPPDIAWWIKLDLVNSNGTDTTVIFYPGFQNFVTAYHSQKGRYTEVSRCGNMIPASALSIPGFRQAITLSVKSDQVNTFYIKVKNVTTYQVDVFMPYLMNRAALDKAQERLLIQKRLPDYFFFMGIGMFAIMLIYIAIKWMYQKDAAYLYYAIAIASSIFYFLFNFFKEHNNQILFSENPFIVHLIGDSFIFLSVFAYWRFVATFLYVDKKSFLGRFVKWGSRIILFSGIISLIYAFMYRNITGIITLNSTLGVIFLMGGIYILFSIRKINLPLRRFVYGGIISLVFFYGLGSFYEIARDRSWNFFPELLGGATPLLMLGNVFEMLFFTIGLAYRNKLETESLAKINVAKAEAEMKALRAQMNPHFIFNCMHTIDAYIFKKQPEKASAFLNQFSKLIRQTLENSEKPLITIAKEIEALRVFINLEQERYDESFSVIFKIDETVLGYKIPPLLLQPYVENAIIHGLRHLKNKKGVLEIAVFDKEEHIHILIADNGIGRKNSTAINTIKQKQHTSMAMELTLQRLQFLDNGQQGDILIKDIEAGGETGTEVIILLPKIKTFRSR